MRSQRPVVHPAALLVAAALGACSSPSSVVADPVSTATEAPEPPEPSATDEEATAPMDLPGEAFDHGPRLGARLLVIGVPDGQALGLRSGPGPEFDVLAEVGPTGVLTSLGQGRMREGSIWQEVRSSGVRGWVDLRSVAMEGGTQDLTQRTVEQLGERPRARDAEALGRLVAESFASSDPPSAITLVDASSSGDLGEVVLDVVGLGDDSVLGVRLRVFAARAEDGGVVLSSVEVTTLCGRGVDDGGLCV